MESNLKVINEKEDVGLEEIYEIGGNWACVIGCGTFCVMGGGYTSAVAAVATAI
ncbi:MAG: hypothetical protein ACRDA4_05505 [Filifactoraceae bacterium]